MPAPHAGHQVGGSLLVGRPFETNRTSRHATVTVVFRTVYQVQPVPEGDNTGNLLFL